MQKPTGILVILVCSSSTSRPSIREVTTPIFSFVWYWYIKGCSHGIVLPAIQDLNARANTPFLYPNLPWELTGTKTSDKNSPGQHTECQGLLGPSVKIVLETRVLPQNSHLVKSHSRSHPGSEHWSGAEEYVLRAGIHMEIHDIVHGAERDVHYNTGEGSTENDKELLSCLQSPPSNTHIKSPLHSASFIYCSAKSDMDFLPSPLHLCSSAPGWKVANQRQWSRVMPRRN